MTEHTTLIVLFEKKGIIVKNILDYLVAFCKKISIAQKCLEISRPRRKLPIQEIASEILDKNKSSFQIDTDDNICNFSFTYNGSTNCMSFGMGFEDEKINNHIEELIKFLAYSNIFIQANMFYSDYSYVQNQIFYDNIAQRGIKIDEKKVYLDTELNRKMVDTSKNPGRRVDHKGYMEMVTSPMYISSNFTKITNTNIEKIKQLEWVKVDEVHEGIYRIESWPHPFDSDGGEQRMRQETLRKLLFPKLNP